jgi:hypothetical protein
MTPEYRVLAISDSDILHFPFFPLFRLNRFAVNDLSRNENKSRMSKLNDSRREVRSFEIFIEESVLFSAGNCEKFPRCME